MGLNVDTNWCTLKVDNEGMYALMCLHTVEGEEGPAITEQVVLDFLSANKICYGIKTNAIHIMLESAMYEQYVCVAQGTPATRGVDGYYTYQKDTEDMKKKPVILEDGTADYKNSLNLAIINKDELLAIYTPPTEGMPGTDVYNQPVKALGNGKNLLPLRGRGIYSDEEKINFYAEYSGHIVKEDSKIYIDKLFRVNGDLDIETGNIFFDGDVEICGDVRSGLSIEAKGDIYIHGHVGACMLKSDKNITIEKGIQGRDVCCISAKENVVCKFVERCKIIAKGNIYADSVLNANLVADNQILVTSKSGIVISSEIYGMAGVTVKEAGNTAGTPTLLRAGLPREVYTKAAELSAKISEANSKIATFNRHLEQQNEQVLSEEMRRQIMRAKIVLDSEKNKHMEELEFIQSRIIEDCRKSVIHVTGIVHEGVRIYIGSSPYLVTEAIKEVTYHVVNNEIIATELTMDTNQP